MLLATRLAFDGGTPAEVARLLDDHYANDLVALARQSDLPVRGAGSRRSARAASRNPSTTWWGWGCWSAGASTSSADEDSHA